MKNIENNIMKLCRQAYAKGWVFSTMNLDEQIPNCGCALQASASELGISPYVYGDAADQLGFNDSFEALYFGTGFDSCMQNENLLYEDEYAKLGFRIGSLLKEEGMV